jgi:hypothetical protein
LQLSRRLDDDGDGECKVYASKNWRKDRLLPAGRNPIVESSPPGGLKLRNITQYRSLIASDKDNPDGFYLVRQLQSPVVAKSQSRVDRFLLASVSAAVASRAHCSIEVVRGEQS